MLQITVSNIGNVSSSLCGLGSSLPPPFLPTPAFFLPIPNPVSSYPVFCLPHSQDVGVHVAAVGGSEDRY